MLWRLSSLLSIVLVLGVLSGCGDRERNEARLLLDRMDRIDLNATPDQRRPNVQALAHLVLRSPDVRRVRDLCVKAHKALLSAEDQQARARAGFRAAGPHGASDTIPAAKARAIDQALAKSNDAIARASRLLPKCENEVAALSSKYGSRR